MPYPNEHSCRLEDPDKFEQDSFRRIRQRTKDGKQVDIIIGRPKGEDKTRAQAIRYPKDDWDADTARQHCEEHGGKFEAAKED